jgi:hypothetical protein
MANVTPPEIRHEGSPIVLDLNGDGIELTSTKDGVYFDLLNVGSYQTAWVKGSDDALLAIDINGNGIIDQGAELFGEASMIGGFFAADGFDALGRIDDTRFGGNGNGLVESNDLMFSQIRVWTDVNHDGASQLSEIQTLKEAGITALNITATTCAKTLDKYGNDLSMRSSFVRQDGSSGTMVDVFFVNRR